MAYYNLYSIILSVKNSMEKLTDVLDMGGYAAYVWPAYLLAIVIMTVMVTATLYALKRVKETWNTVAPSNET